MTVRKLPFMSLLAALLLVGAGCTTTSPSPSPAGESVSPTDTQAIDPSYIGDPSGTMADDDVTIVDDIEADVTVEISGVNFAFSQDEIRVSEGDVVKIVFTSEEGFHDWVVDEFDAATEQIQAGSTSTVIFTADRTGSYEYYCSVGRHREMGMVGTLIVE